MTKTLQQRDVFACNSSYCCREGMKLTSAPDNPNFEDAVRVHWSPIFYFVLGWVHDREVAADLTQDCFWKACRGWEQFRGDSSVFTWLRHIAVNTVSSFARNSRIQFWRRASIHDLTTIEDVLPHPGPSPERSLVVGERLEAVWQAAELLPPRQQLAFVLRFGEEMELPEIARSMKVSEAAVRVHLHRAVRSVGQTVRRRVGSVSV